MHVRLAWSLVALSAVCAVLDTVFTAAHQSLLSDTVWADHGWPMVTLAALGAAVMGALIVSRSARHPVGWLLLTVSLASVSMAAEAYARWQVEGGAPGPETVGNVAAWLSVLTGGPMAMAGFALIFLLAPDGRFASARWRWFGRAAVIGYLLFVAGIATLDPTSFTFGTRDINAAAVVLTTVGVLLIAVALVASAVGIGLRLRHARAEERRQLLWVAASAVSLAAAFVFLLIVQAAVGAADGQNPWLAAIPLFAASLAFPVCIAVAVLRHRLFDIDVIVNRALVVMLATGLVAAAYVLVVVLLGSVAGGGGFWMSLLATAVVAIAFQPLRRRVVRVADRVAFGAAAEPYDALADFSRRLGESPDPATLLPAVADAAASAVGARRAEVRMHVPNGPTQVAVWPTAAEPGDGPSLELDIGEDGEDGDPLATLSVEMPAGRALRTRDTALLRDLAAQSAIAFSNARLSAELTSRVDELARRTHDLDASRRRLITAADAERRRFERSISREVIPHLRPMPEQLLEIAARRPFDPQALTPLHGSAGAALEALREITRGVFPAQLARSGLEPALRSLLGRTVDAVLEIDASVTQRFDPAVEAAAYFCVAEAVRELAAPVAVAVTVRDDELRLVIHGQDGPDLSVTNLRDRVEAAGGRLDCATADGAGTVLEVRLPVAPALVAAES